MPGFRLDYLTSCKSFSKKVKYCKEMLGAPIGNGSSRMVFQIDDETCLKLAKNEKGVAQNMEEMSIARDGFISYIPKVYNGSDTENGLWIVTQYVLPAKASDFKKVLGIPFSDVSLFASHTDKRFNYSSTMIHIILPQALKLVIPGLVNTIIALFKDTSLVIIIGLFDLFSSVQQATVDPTWLGMSTEGYVFAALVYWIFCFSMSRYSQYLEKRFHTGRKSH